MRRSSDSTCVDPSAENQVCNERCQRTSTTEGSFDVNYGVCLCKFSTECDEECENNRTRCNVTRNSDGQVTLSCYDLSGNSFSFNVSSSSGISNHDNKPHSAQFVVMATTAGSSGAFIPQNRDNVVGLLNGQNQAQPRRRKRRAVADSSTITQSGLTIANPIICLEYEQALYFKIEINPINRSLSHYPRYRKNHLLNSNDQFDYGNFRQLHSLIQDSNNSLTSFVHVFTQNGTFVFYDNADPDVEIIVTMKDRGTSCSDISVAPATENTLRRVGVANSQVRVCETVLFPGIIHCRPNRNVSLGFVSLCVVIDLFADRAAILISIVSTTYYGMPRGQIHINSPPEHPIMSFEGETIEIKMAAVSVKRSIVKGDFNTEENINLLLTEREGHAG